MPVNPTYPGVYIEEVPSTVRTITGVSTAVAAFVDYFPKGPLNEAVQLFSMADFEREFGGLHRLSEASYQMQQFFLNGGTEAWAVRVGSEDDKTKLAPAGASLLDSKQGKDVVAQVMAGLRIRGQTAKNPGRWGNGLRAEVDYDTTARNGEAKDLFNLVIRRVDGNGGGPAAPPETHRNLTMSPDEPNSAAEVVNENSRLVQLLIPEKAPRVRPAATGTVGAPIPVPSDAVAAIAKAMGSQAGAKVRVTLSDGTIKQCLMPKGKPPADMPTVRTLLEAALRGPDPAAPHAAVHPALANAEVELWGRGTDAEPFQFHVTAGQSAALYQPSLRIRFEQVEANAKDDPAANLGLVDAVANDQQVPLTGGLDGLAPRGGDLRGSRAEKTGIYALDDVDIFNILCLPRAAEMESATEMAAVYAEAEAYCAERRAFLLLDVPKDVDTMAEMQAWMRKNDTLRHKNAAVYFPRALIADPLNDYRLRSVGASGTIAGLFAQTDATRGVWKAPAGIDARLRNVQQLAYALTDAENGALNPLGVNCLRTMPVHGNIAWGARTLDGADQQASEWKYLPVRRLALYIEESLYRGTKWAVFEPNDESLWSQLRLNAGAFMHGLFRQGAFQGTSPKEAYFVKCDKDTTTQDDINRGVVNVLVGFAPLKPAEFILLRISQIAGQIET
jgi:hypothetical protein